MLITLDTNVLIRFFTKDELDKATLAKKLLTEKKNLLLPDVVFPEIEYVLTGQYDVSREKILELFQFLASQKNIKTSSFAKKAVAIFEKTKLDMADCIIAAYSLKGVLASFDKELLQVGTVQSFWK